MNAKTLSKELLGKTIQQTKLPGVTAPTRGKVRDIYDLGDRLLQITTDRISAFDVVLGTIPCKGQVLNAIANHWFGLTKNLVENHLLAIPDPCAIVVRKLSPLPVEVVVRRYLTGSLWREYEKGVYDIYGLTLPAGMRQDERFVEPIITPTTKAEQGEHDAPLTDREVVSKNLVDVDLWTQVKKVALDLFAYGEQEAARNGLILVDTKYEFGLDKDKLYLIDEVHTPDSSRYWEQSMYRERFEQGAAQKMLDKENIRQWLLQRGFSGQGPAPELTDEVRLELSQTYMNLQKRLTGSETEIPTNDPHERLVENLRKSKVL